MEIDLITQALARIARKPVADLQPHHALGSIGLTSSFGLSALRGLIEAQAGIKLPPLNLSMTVAEVAAMVAAGGGEAVALPPAAPEQRAEQLTEQLTTSPFGDTGAAGQGLGLGMDMQEIGALPVVSDYRSDSFYASHFTPQEIATAHLKPDPRAHLCGVFCAKEAAKKSHPALLNLRMTDMMVSHDPAGRPLMRLMGDSAATLSLSFLLSITHTEHYAAATCLTLARQT